MNIFHDHLRMSCKSFVDVRSVRHSLADTRNSLDISTFQMEHYMDLVFLSFLADYDLKGFMLNILQTIPSSLTGGSACYSSQVTHTGPQVQIYSMSKFFSS